MSAALIGMDGMLEAAAAAGDMPGAIATVVDRDGVLYEGAAGKVRVGGAAEATTDTMIWIASMTKALTTVAVLQLVEQDRVDLDQEVASILPEFGELQVLEGFDGDQPRLRPPASAATVRQLITHTSGLGYPFLDLGIQRWHEVTGCPDGLACNREFLKAPLVADPGTRWEYGTGVDWAGALVEQVTESTLDAYLAEHLFEPLGMSDTTFELSDEQRERLMPIHARLPDGSLAALDLALPAAPAMACGGHGAYSTARDYGRFLSALLRGGHLDGARILREETVELALSPQIGAIALPDVIKTTDPALTNDIVALPVRRSWGLGFELVLEDLPGMRRAGTGAWAGLANCYYWLDRAGGVAGVLLTQILPFFDDRVIAAAAQLELAAYADVADPAPA
ncbi:MAG: methyl acetate hydrolase [Solirubrobacterales bacterium]|jgi:CubicO group peptidase (beta-lactamase class C family)|nr:methyl acetate hydrolase [Solirubrobacterales bacterium]